jgi:hypothetical protein
LISSDAFWPSADRQLSACNVRLPVCWLAAQVGISIIVVSFERAGQARRSSVTPIPKGHRRVIQRLYKPAKNQAKAPRKIGLGKNDPKGVAPMSPLVLCRLSNACPVSLMEHAF